MKENDESRKYSAYQMRVASKACEEGGHRTVAAMLRQAADMMENDVRKKKWEYSVKSIYGEVCGLHDDDKPRIPCLDNRFTRNCIIVRRSVGEWEEVDDVQQ